MNNETAPVILTICAGLEFLGINLDVTKNARNAPVISGAGSAVTVRVIQTNEELMIAQHTSELSGWMERRRGE